MSDPNTVNVSILDREYLVACPPEEREALHAAARLLDARLRELRQHARSATLERLAVMAALNLAHELKQTQSRSESLSGGAEQELKRLIQRLDTVLAES